MQAVTPVLEMSIMKMREAEGMSMVMGELHDMARQNEDGKVTVKHTRRVMKKSQASMREDE